MTKLTMCVLGAILFAVAIFAYAALIYCGWNWFLVAIFPQVGVLTFNKALIAYFAKSALFYTYTEQKEREGIEACKHFGKMVVAPIIMICFLFAAKLILL